MAGVPTVRLVAFEVCILGVRLEEIGRWLLLLLSL